MNSITINDQRVFYLDFINPYLVKDLFFHERILFSFNSKLKYKSSRGYININPELRKEYNIYNENIVVLRIKYKNDIIQLISKIYKSGKIYIPLEILKHFSLKDSTTFFCDIINNEPVDNKKLGPNYLDLTKILSDLKIILRYNNFITLYKKEKIAITIPRYIQITPSLIEFFYLIHGDGHYKYKFYFVNKQKELHEFILNEFERVFYISREMFRAKLIVSNLNNYEELINYWCKDLNLTNNQFYRPSISKFNVCETGNLRIIIDKTIFSIIFQNLFEKIKTISLTNQSFYALNGLLAAEGGAEVVQNKGLHKITLSFNIKEKNMFELIILDLGLNYKIQKNNSFVISSWLDLVYFMNIYLQKDIIPMDLHPLRKRNLFLGFNNHRFTQTLKKYLFPIQNLSPITLKQYSPILNIREDSILRIVNNKKYVKYFIIQGNGKNRDPFRISISPEGLNFLTLISKVENIIKNDIAKN